MRVGVGRKEGGNKEGGGNKSKGKKTRPLYVFAEHPLTLEQLNVASLDNIQVDNESSRVSLTFTPTIPHCRSHYLLIVVFSNI